MVINTYQKSKSIIKGFVLFHKKQIKTHHQYVQTKCSSFHLDAIVGHATREVNIRLTPILQVSIGQDLDYVEMGLTGQAMMRAETFSV